MELSTPSPEGARTDVCCPKQKPELSSVNPVEALPRET